MVSSSLSAKALRFLMRSLSGGGRVGLAARKGSDCTGRYPVIRRAPHLLRGLWHTMCLGLKADVEQKKFTNMQQCSSWSCLQQIWIMLVLYVVTVMGDICICKLLHMPKSETTHCSQMLARQRRNPRQAAREKQRLVEAQTGGRAKKKKQIRKWEQKEIRHVSPCQICYLRGCFWRAWWTVECVADISSSSPLEFVSQRCLSYPEKQKKKKIRVSEDDVLSGCFPWALNNTRFVTAKLHVTSVFG